jgi:hypothetical protein
LFACVQAAFQAVVKQYIEHEIVQRLPLEQVAAKSFGMDETMAAIKWAETSGTVPGTWKLSADGWKRELGLSGAEKSHLLGYCARGVWTTVKSKARSELKKQQEREQRKRPAEEQPEGTAEAKRDKQTR